MNGCWDSQQQGHFENFNVCLHLEEVFVRESFRPDVYVMVLYIHMKYSYTSLTSYFFNYLRSMTLLN
jgi:hypothetical protein